MFIVPRRFRAAACLLGGCFIPIRAANFTPKIDMMDISEDCRQMVSTPSTCEPGTSDEGEPEGRAGNRFYWSLGVSSADPDAHPSSREEGSKKLRGILKKSTSIEGGGAPGGPVLQKAITPSAPETISFLQPAPDEPESATATNGEEEPAAAVARERTRKVRFMEEHGYVEIEPPQFPSDMEEHVHGDTEEQDVAATLELQSITSAMPGYSNPDPAIGWNYTWMAADADSARATVADSEKLEFSEDFDAEDRRMMPLIPRPRHSRDPDSDETERAGGFRDIFAGPVPPPVERPDGPVLSPFSLSVFGPPHRRP